MKISLTGISAELFGQQEIETDLKPEKVSDIKQYLLSAQPDLAGHQIFVAVNSVMADDSKDLDKEDLILVFHPYSGG